MTQLALPTPDAIDAVLTFRPWFQPPRETFGTSPPPVITEGILEYSYTELDPDVEAFISALNANGFIQPFDRGTWQSEALAYVREPHRLETADLETLVQLLTLHVRQDRFCEGHLLQMLTSGHIQAILDRLAHLHSAETAPEAPERSIQKRTI